MNCAIVWGGDVNRCHLSTGRSEIWSGFSWEILKSWGIPSRHHGCFSTQSCSKGWCAKGYTTTKISRKPSSNIATTMTGWWARATPLKNMSQLGWLATQYMGNMGQSKMATKPPTRWSFPSPAKICITFPQSTKMDIWLSSPKKEKDPSGMRFFGSYEYNFRFFFLRVLWSIVWIIMIFFSPELSMCHSFYHICVNLITFHSISPFEGD